MFLYGELIVDSLVVVEGVGVLGPGGDLELDTMDNRVGTMGRAVSLAFIISSW